MLNPITTTVDFSNKHFLFNFFQMCLLFFSPFKEQQVTNTVNLRNKLPDKKIYNNDKNKINYIK